MATPSNMQNFPSSPSDPQHQQTKPGRRVTHLMHQLRQDCTRISLPTLAHLCPPPTEKTHNPFNTVDPIPIPDPSQETRLTTSVNTIHTKYPCNPTIPLQSGIPWKSQCNCSTDVPEYIELGRQPRHVRPPIAPGLRHNQGLHQASRQP